MTDFIELVTVTTHVIRIKKILLPFYSCVLILVDTRRATGVLEIIKKNLHGR